MKIPKNLLEKIRISKKTQKLVDLVRMILVLSSKNKGIPINNVYKAFNKLYENHRTDFEELNFDSIAVYSSKLEKILFEFGVWDRINVVGDSYIIKCNDKNTLMDLYKNRYGVLAARKAKEYAKKFLSYLD